MNNMFNPEFMNQMKGMMNPQMMKQAAANFGNMSDDQIKSYLSASGMGHISPQMFRQMSGNLKNMDDGELERIKNMNANNIPRNNPYQPQNNSYSTNPTLSTTKNINNTTNQNKQSSNVEYVPPKRKTIVEKLNEDKNHGNNFFKECKYKEACEKYYEVLNEIEYISDSDKINYKKEIEDLEIVCRLNIANSKLKLEDYDLVINECLKVLKKGDNFKAHHRAGLSFYKKGNYSKACLHFTKAREINKNEDSQQLEKYLKECQQFLDDQENERKLREYNDSVEANNLKNLSVPEKTEKEQENNPKNFNPVESNNLPNQTPENSSQPEVKKMSKYDKIKEIVHKEVKLENDSQNNYSNKNKRDDEILIEEEKIKNSKKIIIEETVDTSFNNNYQNNKENNFQGNSDLFKNVGREINNMPENEMTGMVNMIRNMDNATLKSMMQMQGMNLSDEQISMMKNTINPEMMRMMKNNSGGFPNMPMGGNIRQNNSENNSHFNCNHTDNHSNKLNSNNENHQATDQSSSDVQPNNMKSFPDLKNMDMNSMLKFVQDNPQILNMMGPQMSKMFGGGMGGANGMNNEVMMNSMQNILWIMSLPQRIRAFFTSTRGMMFSLFVIILIFSYLYK